MRPADDIKKLIEQMNDTTSAEMDKKVLNDAVQALADSKETSSADIMPNVWRIIMKNRITKLAAAAVILLAVLFGITLIPSQSAYAHIVKELRDFRTLTYTLIRQTNLQPSQTTKIQVAHKTPHFARTTTVDGYISILDDAQGKMITLIPDLQAYVSAEYINLPAMEGTDPFEIIERMKRLPSRADEELGTKEIEGILVEGYRVFEEDVIITIWIDPDSMELVQVEQEYPSSPGMNFIMKDIQMDINLDDSLFSLEPPVGYKQGLSLSADVAQVTETDFINFFQTWIDLTVDKTFPPTLWGPEFGKVVIELAKQGKFTQPWTDENSQKIYQGSMFLSQIPQDDWRYMGQNVPFGDPETPVFWYRPVGSKTYRVIYADLSVVDVWPEDLPK